jgi:hypothetical protein
LDSTQAWTHVRLRERALGAATVCAAGLMVLHELVKGLPARVVLHPPSITAAEKQFELGMPCQKTVTVSLPDGRALLLTGVGDFRAGRGERRSLIRELGYSSSETRRVSVNSPAFDVRARCRLLAGMVSPFLPRASDHDLSWLAGVAVLDDDDPAGPVSVALSPFESAVLERRALPDLVRSYREQMYPAVPQLALRAMSPQREAA